MANTTLESPPAGTAPAAADSSPAEPGHIFNAVPGLRQICGFQIFFVGSFFIIGGDVIKLMVRHWGAGEFLIGILTSLMPATQVVQIFVAPYVERVNVKRYILIGLALRHSFYTCAVVIPFLVYKNILPTSQALYFFMAFMICVDFAYGIGFLPWFTWLSQIVPERWRGRYFSIEQIMNTIVTIVLVYLAGVFIGQERDNLRFGLYLALGAAMSWISLYFISRVPPVPVLKPSTDGKRVNPFNLGWVPGLVKIVPFRRMLYVIAANQFTMSLGTFGILFSTEELHLRQDVLMKLGAVSPIGSALAVYVWGILSDKFGSRPVLALSYRFFVVNILVGFLIALFMPRSAVLIYTLTTAFGFLANIGMIGYNINNFRYLLGCVPKDVIAYASVLYGLTVQLTFAIWPPLVGKFLELTKGMNYIAGPFHLHRYTILNGAMLLGSLLTLVLMYRLENHESDATPNGVFVYAMKRIPNAIRASLKVFSRA